MNKRLVEVYPGLWVDHLHAVWHVDNKTWLLLATGKNHWIPGDHVDEVVRKWQEATS